MDRRLAEKKQVTDRQLINSLVETNRRKGWASYTSDEYTSGDPLEITEGSTESLIINGGTSELSYAPFYSLLDTSTGKITPYRLGDFLTVVLKFKAKSGSGSGEIITSIDFGGATGEDYKISHTLDMGVFVVHDITVNYLIPVNSDFFDNGGLPKIKAVTGYTEVYDATIIIKV